MRSELARIVRLTGGEGNARPGVERALPPAVAGPAYNRSRPIREFLNDRYGAGAAGKLRLGDLNMEDVEAYNRSIVAEGFSALQVAKRLQFVKAIIDRAGRREHGRQVLSWNWDSRDVLHGAPPKDRMFPTVRQLENLLASTDLRGRPMIWLGVGLGFGGRDLAAIRIVQIAKDRYYLRRVQAGVERYGLTPPLVWAYVSAYHAADQRSQGDLLFLTRNGLPLVQGSTNAVALWWTKLRDRIGETKESLRGFYALRHLGATEFSCRRGTSSGDVKRWLGHSASSNVTDLHMRPVHPECQKLVDWACKQLQSKRIPHFKPRRPAAAKQVSDDDA